MLLFVSFLQSMDLLKHEAAPSIQHKLNAAFDEWKQEAQNYRPIDIEYMEICHAYHRKVATIVLNAGSDVCPLEKLELLVGDRYYKQRKEIVYDILDQLKNKVENFDPCSICYQVKNPLLESIVYADIEFATDLLRAGARPDKKALKELKDFPSEAISELFTLFESDTSKIYEFSGIKYKKNNFGDIFPVWQEVPAKDLPKKLSRFISCLDIIKGTPCIIEVPHHKAAVLNTIKEAQFTLYYADNEKTEWIFKNGSSIPLPYTAIIGAQILVQKNDTVLVIEEKTRRGLLGFPAGTAELQELPRETASRELKEEVNLCVLPQDLELFAMINRVKANRFKANSVNHYFLVDNIKVSGELKPDGKEVRQAFYAPLQDIAEQKSIQGLSISPAVAALAKHLQSGRTKSYSQDFLDYRQLSKSESCCDNTDIMTIEFFAK